MDVEQDRPINALNDDVDEVINGPVWFGDYEELNEIDPRYFIDCYLDDEEDNGDQQNLDANLFECDLQGVFDDENENTEWVDIGVSVDNPVEVNNGPATSSSSSDDNSEEPLKKKKKRNSPIKSLLPHKARIQDCRKKLEELAADLFTFVSSSEHFEIPVRKILEAMIVRMKLEDCTSDKGKIRLSSSWDGTNMGNTPFFVWGLKLVEYRSRNFTTGKKIVESHNVQSRNHCMPVGVAFCKDLKENVDEYLSKFYTGKI